MKSVIGPLDTAPSIAPMATKEPNMENCHFHQDRISYLSEFKHDINVNEEEKLECQPQQEID